MKYLVTGLLIALLSGCSTVPEPSYIQDPSTLSPIVPSLDVSHQDLYPIAYKLNGAVIDVFGYSMYPYIPPWSQVILEPEAYEDLAIGDVIVYLDDYGTLVCHRIIEKDVSGFKVKGDNNTEPDPGYVREFQYQGKVRGVIYP